MRYYRLVLKKENGKVLASEIVEQYIDEDTYNNMVWDKPIISSTLSDGKEGVITYHFTALDPSYLEAFLAGMQVYIDLMK